MILGTNWGHVGHRMLKKCTRSTCLHEIPGNLHTSNWPSLTLLAAGGASGGRMSKIDVSMIFCYNFMILNNIHKKKHYNHQKFV